jgi:HK97 family phage major capsid protein
MKETKTASGTPAARAAMHEMIAALEAFKGANDARLDEIEKKAWADTLLEEKVTRIDQAVAAAQARLDWALSEGRRPAVGGTAVPVTAPEAKSAFDSYPKTGASFGLELKAGLSSSPSSGGYVVPVKTERALPPPHDALVRDAAGNLADGRCA